MPLYPKRSFGRLNSIFERDNLKVVISGRFENLFEFSKHYGNALNALTEGLESGSGEHLFVYNEDDERPD